MHRITIHALACSVLALLGSQPWRPPSWARKPWQRGWSTLGTGLCRTDAIWSRSALAACALWRPGAGSTPSQRPSRHRRRRARRPAGRGAGQRLCQQPPALFLLLGAGAGCGPGKNSTALAKARLSADASALENVQILFSQRPRSIRPCTSAAASWNAR
jgi:hypothetical protein